MTSGEILTYGKALIWFALPLALAFRELWLLRHRDRRGSDRDQELMRR